MQHTLTLALACLLTAAADASPPGATEYVVDTASSEVNIQVYSHGLLARLGHNHVMTSRSVQGRVSVGSASPHVAFDLSFPAGELIVDDQQERIAAGSEFPLNLTPADRAAARKNMLG